MNELSLIKAIQRWTASGGDKSVVAGIGDDCAILRPAKNEDLLVTTDLSIEGVHFQREALSAKQIGMKTFVRGLSDIAAMGGTPRYAFFSIVLAPWTCMNFMHDFYAGVMSLAREHGVTIAGGDVSRGVKFTADVMVMGTVARGKGLRRDTAKTGDDIYVSGPLGGTAASGWKNVATPRLDLAPVLHKLKATSCMDLSDGLSLDLHRLCTASGVAAEIESAAVPVARKATLEQALHGGEDYELLFTLKSNARVPAGLGLVRVGTIVEGKPGRMMLDGKALEPRGWDPVSPSDR